MAAKMNEELLEFCYDTWEVNRRADVRRKSDAICHLRDRNSVIGRWILYIYQ